MQITTFNCNSVRKRVDQIIGWMAANPCDVLALQETKVVDDDFPIQPFENAGLHVVFRGQKSYNGVAMVTREPVEEARFGLEDGEDGEDGDSGPRLARIMHNGIIVVNTYVPQGRSLDSDKFQFKLEWLKRLRRYFEKNFGDAASAKVVWVGDCNVAPTADDVYDSKKVWPHVCHCQEVIDAFENVLDWGFVDVFRKHVDGPAFTFWDYRVPNALKRDVGWRIDHVLATPSLAAKSKSVSIDREARTVESPSDHTFVTAEFAVL